MRAQLLASLRAVVVLTILCGIAYPLFVTGFAQLLWKDQADGSLIERDGKVVGSSLIGQAFTEPRYFHPRPSAAGAAAFGSYVDVDADGHSTGEAEPADPDDLSLVSSGASNFGPTNPDFLKLVDERVETYREENGLDPSVRIPVDAVTASGSGLDPQISVANARLQAPRVARERGLPEDVVRKLIDEHAQHASLAFLGEKGVNVLELNLALDAVKSS